MDGPHDQRPNVDEVAVFSGVLFGLCYVPPPVSPYFDFILLSYIQEKERLRVHGSSCIIVRNLNARFGEAVHEFPSAIGREQWSYLNVSHKVRTPNDNASALLCCSPACIE